MWKRKSQPWSASASDAAFAAATSSKEPVKTVRTSADGFTDFMPPSKARKVDLMDGSSTPPTIPAFPVFDIRPATRPHRYVACSSSKTIGARFGAVREPEVVTKTVFGYSAATRAAASWNSNPWPKQSA